MGIASTLTQRATVYRNMQVGTDPYGNVITDMQIVALDVPCRMLGINARVMHNEASELNERAIAVAFLKNANVMSGDRLDISSMAGEEIYKGVEVIETMLVDNRYLEVKARVLE